MRNTLKYMVDEKGTKTSVIVPIKMWEEMSLERIQLQKKLKILTEIQEGIQEVKNFRESGKKLQTLQDFLRESNR